MIELKCKGSVEYAEKIEIQARETFGDCGILIGRDGDKVRMAVSYVNDQFDERDFVEFLKSVDCTIPMDSIFYLNEGVVWKKDAYKLCYMKKEELPSIIEQNMFAGEMLSALFFVRVIVDLDMLDEIDFDALPEQFVLKCTHDSGSVVICKDKSKFDYNAAKAKLERKFNMDLYWWAREWVYKDIKPRIIAEKYMNDGIHDDIMDYKFFCFNGEPKYIYVSENLSDHKNGAISFYDMDFKEAPFRRTDYKNLTYTPDKPLTFDKMAELSKILSKDQYFLRVDFYEISGKIYFGELTFYPAAGYMHIAPDEWDVKLGEMLNIEG